MAREPQTHSFPGRPPTMLLLVALSYLVPCISWTLGPLVPCIASRSETAILSTRQSLTASTGPTTNVAGRHSTKSTILVHWKGEIDTEYSKPFRHIEFSSALAAHLDLPLTLKDMEITFENALDYDGAERFANITLSHYNEAIQYLCISEKLQGVVSKKAIIEAVRRSCLVHAAYEVVSSGGTYDDLIKGSTLGGGFQDMYRGGTNENATWCFRVRSYGDDRVAEDAPVGRIKRFGERARSMALEREGLEALKDVLGQFGGRVDLKSPATKIYVFDGLVGAKKTLTRRIACGPRGSIINPSTRICVTNTPLHPIAAFALCNVARVRQGCTVLDPYAGSCTTLLASAMIAPSATSVGIELAHDGLVNRPNIRKDFESRNFTQPAAILLGDSTDELIRDKARGAIGGSPFHCIVTDPPYGVRESLSGNARTPLEDLFTSIARDREANKRLLMLGGRLSAFVPVTEEQTIAECLPSADLLKEAGLRLEVCREQRLRETLSRYLVSYVCIK